MAKKFLVTLYGRINSHKLCQRPGCWCPGIVDCYLPDRDYRSPYGKFYGRFCSKHAVEEGFCGCCGQFWAGIESFDFNPRGLCDNCEADLALDLEEFEEENEDEYAWWEW